MNTHKQILSPGHIITIATEETTEHYMVLTVNSDNMSLRRLADDYLVVLYENNYGLITDEPPRTVFERTNPTNGLYERWVRGVELLQTSNIENFKALKLEIEADFTAQPSDEQLLVELETVNITLAAWADYSRLS